MRDDLTPTREQATDTLGAQLEVFRGEPENASLFRELRRGLRKAQQTSKLAEICELHAATLSDRLRAASTWFEAAELRLQTGEAEAAECALRRTLDEDPTHDKANTALFDLLVDGGRYAEAADLAENEIRILTEREDSGDAGGDRGQRRRAHRHRVVARLWDEKLGRVEKALSNWQRAWQLEPDNPEPLVESRNIYRSLGDEKMVIQLYETELEIMERIGSDRRRIEVELALGRLKQKSGDTEGAAGHLESALALDPDNVEAREALAEVYASATFAGDDEQRARASELFVDLGRRRLETHEEEQAIGYLRRALGVDPYSQEGTSELEQALIAARRWRELDRLYEHRLQTVEGDEERIDLLLRRADVFENRLDDREGLKSTLLSLASMHPPQNRFAARLRELYEEDGDFERLAQLIEAELISLEDRPSLVIRELLELATVYREHLDDRDKAADCLHRVLTMDSTHEEALARYADHFRERRDWRGLADLHEFAISEMEDRGSPPAEVMRRLEEIAQLCEVRLGDVDRAIQTWQRISELEPASPKAREALRRLMSRAKMWESLVGVLENEAQQATTPSSRAEALRRIAQVYRERQVNPRRAIAIYEEIVTLFPDDDGALKALAELYEREGDDAGLAHTLRRQLDIDLRRFLSESQATGERPGTAREWPVAKRVERLTALRRLASMYEQRLADVDGVVFACSGILEILPGDRDALERMERVLDKAGDTERLEQTLEYHAASSTAPAERAKVLSKLAQLAQERQDEVAAMERWEHVLRAAPNDREALVALPDLYERHSRWGELAEVLERSLMGAEPPPPGSAEAAERAGELKRYARVVHDQLGDAMRATRAWQKVLEVSSRDRDALAALADLYEQSSQWRQRTEMLERQIPLYAQDDKDRAAELAFQRAELLDQRLGAPEEAIRALEGLIDSVDPTSLRAHKMLRRLYETRGDFDQAVRVAEREMFLTEDPAETIARGLEIGILCRDRLDDPRRALQAFGRVLELDPEHDEALRASAELYAAVGSWPMHIKTLEKRIDICKDEREARTLMMRIAQAVAERIGDHRAAFRWYRRAHERAPDATTITELRRTAENYDLWRELAEVYEAEREALRQEGAAPDNPAAYVATCRELAAIAEHRLGDPVRAMKALQTALEVQPNAEDVLAEAERIALAANKRVIWTSLLECLELAHDASNRDRRISILLRRAQIREEHMNDAAAAGEELLRAFSWAPEREDVRDALLELAERTRDFSSVLAVERALAERAPTPTERLELLQRRAAILENKAGEKTRAFRLLLSAFLLAPENEQVVSDLWRLAREIGTYSQTDQTPMPEPPAAHIEGAADLPAPAAPHRIVAARRPRREATDEISLADLEIEEESDDDTSPDVKSLKHRDDPTQTLQVGDLLDVRRRDATVELRTEDLIEALGVKKKPSGTPEPPRAQMRSKGAPPPPPPPRPTIRRMPGMTPAPPRRRQAAPTSQPIPQMPKRAYSSPWSEFAAAYGMLPAPDRNARARWQFRAAEVWERGAEDIPRAFGTLADVLRDHPDDAEAKSRLHRLAAEHGEWDRLADLYLAAAEDAASAKAASELLLAVAEIRTEQNRPNETESLYRRVLGMRPDDATARLKLEEHYRGENRWIDLAASLEERTDPRLGSAAPVAERPALLAELADIYEEKLGRVHDAIEALEKLRELVPDDIDLLERLAALYGRIDRWSRVIDVLTKVADAAAEGSEIARGAYRRIGDIYERELELPDRAIDAYAQILAQWTQDEEAFSALDRLFQQFGRWNDLEDLLRRRAAITRDAETRANLLRRRASILMKHLDQAEEAASALRHARTILPDDSALGDELVEALVLADREREAAAVLEGRIQALKDRNGAIGNVAALLIRLASLRAEKLRDPHGARNLLEEALDLVPDHPTALATLARLAEAQRDPKTYASAKLREAEVLSDVDARVEALLAAGAALRDCQEIADARQAFERVLEIRPYHADAIWALAALVEQAGDLDEAIRLLEARLAAASLDVSERAEILTQLAALSRQAGVDAAAERRLREAIAESPRHLPAILGLADLLQAAERWDDLDTFLASVIENIDQEETATIAELHRRRAVAFEGLSRPDAAYQTLIEADRMDRGNLLVKLALGENRYRARRWREAGLHLGALAEHPQAEMYPAEVAQGLYHAALAEIRSLRPDKAEGLYERALELKNNFGPALHALAELAMERGEVARAADLLTRQAMATENAAERLRLFEALGDMAAMQLEDLDRARVCYDAAVGAAQPLESKHTELLRKLLDVQRKLGDPAGAGKTYELLSSFASTPEERAGLLVLASEQFKNAEDEARARAAARRAVEASPYDITAVTVASEMALAADDHDEAAAMLGRALSLPEAQEDEVQAARRALLYARLSSARLRRGDRKGARTAAESALEIGPESEGAMLARRLLVDLWADVPGREQKLVEFLRILAEETMDLDDILAYGRRLRERDVADGGRAVLELASALGAELSDADVAFLGRHPMRVMAEDQAYQGSVSARMRRKLIADPDDGALAEVSLAIWEAAALLFSDTGQALDALGLHGAERVRAQKSVPAAAVFTRIARALDAPATVLYSCAAPGAPDVQVVCASPPLVVLGPRLSAGAGEPPSDLELRFILARAAELARPERILAAGLPRRRFLDLVAALHRIFGQGTSEGDLDSEVHKSDEELRKTLPVKIRAQLEKLLDTGSPPSGDAFLRACHRAADRAGLLICGDLDTARRFCTNPLDGEASDTRHLETLILRRGYLEARAKLGVGAK